ncbi:TIGR02466 family protein [bacterium]|nr:TIGR02466 family protein [bacterium]
MSLQVARFNLFPNDCFNTDLEGIDNDAIAKYAYELRALDSKGAGKPAEDGWQSDNITSSPFHYENLMSKICEAMDEVVSQLNLPPVQLYNTWININPPKTYIDSHTHDNALFSGVYYIKTPENCGNIVFKRMDNARYFMPILSGPNSFLSTRSEVMGKEGLLLIFPAWLHHQVLLNNSKEDRISMSFNFGAPLADKS